MNIRTIMGVALAVISAVGLLTVEYHQTAILNDEITPYLVYFLLLTFFGLAGLFGIQQASIGAGIYNSPKANAEEDS